MSSIIFLSATSLTYRSAWEMTPIPHILQMISQAKHFKASWLIITGKPFITARQFASIPRPAQEEQ
jgi:hypothetical protein